MAKKIRFPQYRRTERAFLAGSGATILRERKTGNMAARSL